MALASPALVAAALALLVHLLGWQGPDQAAQTYRVDEVRLYGFVLWDSGWYGGNFPFGYSVLFPFLGAAVGLLAVGVASAAAATYGFDRLLTLAWGRRGVASWYFAVSTVLPVAIGQLPFLAGEAFGLLALLAMGHRRKALTVLLAVASALCSPLSGAFTALACLAWALSRQDRRRWRRPGSTVITALAAAAAALGLILVVALLFPGTGSFPYGAGALVLTLLFCASFATPIVPSTPALRWGALLVAVVAVGDFALPNPVGGNLSRLVEAVGVPVLVGLVFLPDPQRAGVSLPFAPLARGPHPPGSLAARGRRTWQAAVGVLAPRGGRPRALRALVLAVMLGGFAAWQWGPGLEAFQSSRYEPAASASFYQPLLRQVLRRSHGPVRVEAVPTKDHWESVYLAPTVSLARGWERQLDVADNPLFYQPGALTPASYLSWLRDNGVSWVALPDTGLDYAATGEATLLGRRSVPGLELVWSSAKWRLWRVEGGPGLVSGPGRLVALDPDHLDLSIAKPSVLTVRVRYTRLWDLAGAGSGAAVACVAPTADGWTQVIARTSGRLDLAVSVLRGHPAACPSS